jgi:mono/diheme cytochrome c family protein
MSIRKWVIPLSLLAVVAGLNLGGCPTQPAAVTGDVTAGQAEFTELCAGCHSAASLAGVANRIVNDLETVSAAMNGIVLTDQEVADLKAFLATK